MNIIDRLHYPKDYDCQNCAYYFESLDGLVHCKHEENIEIRNGVINFQKYNCHCRNISNSPSTKIYRTYNEHMKDGCDKYELYT